MIDIHYIQDANLISARFHAIDIEGIETRCLELKALLESPPGASASTDRWPRQVEKLEDCLWAVLVHVWPSPGDPVVRMLLQEASCAMDRAGQVRARLSRLACLSTAGEPG